MRATMSTTAAFKALAAVRAARRNVGGYTVRQITKSGQPSKMLFRWQGQSEFTLEQANEFKINMEKNNPGKTWMVVPV